MNKESPIDAVTINLYFGTDGVKPFLDVAKENEKRVFVLVKTSNEFLSEIQDLELKDGKKVYQRVAELVKEWGDYVKDSDDEEYSFVGAVVGTTHLEGIIEKSCYKSSKRVIWGSKFIFEK